MPDGAIEVRWDAKARAWFARPPWSGWTRLDGTGDMAETDHALRFRALRTFADRAVLGLRIVRVDA